MLFFQINKGKITRPARLRNPNVEGFLWRADVMWRQCGGTESL